MDKDVRSEKAKQGRWGGHVLLILIGGLALAMLVWAVVEFYGTAISPDAPPGQLDSQPAQTESGTQQQ